MRLLLTSSLIVAAITIPAAAYAYPPNDAPSQTIVGSFDGKFQLTVREQSGSLDRIALHKGTVINPTGAALRTGLPVTIVGYVDGGTFDANSIDATENAASADPIPSDTSPFARTDMLSSL